MSVPHQTITDAWCDMQRVLKAELANSDPDWHAPPLDLGRDLIISRPGLNRFLSPFQFVFFGLRIFVFQGIDLQPPIFSEVDEALLPIGFSTLQMEGRYRLHFSDLSKGGFRKDIEGHVRLTVSNSTLLFHLSIATKPALTRLSLNGLIAIEADWDVEVPNRAWWTGEEYDRFEGITVARGHMPQTMPGEFLAPALGNALISAVEKKLGV